MIQEKEERRMDSARNMGQGHRKKTGEEEDKLNKIRESERPLQKEMPKPGQGDEEDKMGR